MVCAAVLAATLLLVAGAALSARPNIGGGSRSGGVAVTQRLAVLAEASGLGSKLKQLVSFIRWQRRSIGLHRHVS